MPGQVADEHEAVQGFGLAPAAVERQHQLAPAPLPQRLGASQLLGQHSRPFAVAGGQLGVEPVLLGRPASFLEAGHLGLGDGAAGDVRQGRSPPYGERGLQDARRPHRLVARQLGATGGGEGLEPFGVELTRVQLEQVTGRSSFQRRRPHTQPVPQRRHMDLQRVPCRGRWARLPQRLDQHVGRDNQSGVDGQRRQQRALQAAANGRGRAVPTSQLDRPQEPDLGKWRRRGLAHGASAPRLERILSSPAHSSPLSGNGKARSSSGQPGSPDQGGRGGETWPTS